MSISADLRKVAELGYRQTREELDSRDEEGDLQFCLIGAIYFLHTGKRIGFAPRISLEQQFTQGTGYETSENILFDGDDRSLLETMVYLNDNKKYTFLQAAEFFERLGK